MLAHALPMTLPPPSDEPNPFTHAPFNPEVLAKLMRGQKSLDELNQLWDQGRDRTPFTPLPVQHPSSPPSWSDQKHKEHERDVERLLVSPGKPTGTGKLIVSPVRRSPGKPQGGSLVISPMRARSNEENAEDRIISPLRRNGSHNAENLDDRLQYTPLRRTPEMPDDRISSHMHRRSAEGSNVGIISPPRRSPQKADGVTRVQRAVQRMQMAVALWKDAEIHVYGSTVNGFGADGADIDMTVQVSFAEFAGDFRGQRLRNLQLQGLRQLEMQCKYLGFTVREAVVDARVPVLRLSFGDVECDVTINNLLPLYNSKLLKAYTEVDARVVPLVQDLKRWATANGLHNASSGHLSSYSLTLLGLFYCQVAGALPSLQAMVPNSEDYFSPSKFLGLDGPAYCVGFASSSSATVQNFIKGQAAWPAEVSLAGFFRFFGREFVWGDEVVSVRVGRRRSKGAFPGLQLHAATAEPLMLHIEDPIETSRDLACVMAPGNSTKLRSAMAAEAARMSPRSPTGPKSPERKKETPQTKSPPQQHVQPQTAAPMPHPAHQAPAHPDLWNLPVPPVMPQHLLDPAIAEQLRPFLARALGVTEPPASWPAPPTAAWPTFPPSSAPWLPSMLQTDDRPVGRKEKHREEDKEQVGDWEQLRGAVQSLYDDQVKPTIGIIRRRMQELYDADLSCKAIEQTLVQAPGVILDGKTSNHTAVLVGQEGNFVDPLDPSDPFPEDIWNCLYEVVSVAAEKQVYWRGGRYGCAQQLKALPILSHYTLGRVQHLVQLAIQKKLLGYKGGTLVAYELSRHGHKGNQRDTGVA